MAKKRTSLEIEGILEDNLEAQQEADCNQNYSSTGLCPCCGVELENKIIRWIGDFDTVSSVEESQQVCSSCGWTSDYLYDA